MTENNNRKDLDVMAAATIKASENRLLKHAANYAYTFNWAVFPVHGIVNGECTCDKPSCSSPGKHPRIRSWQQLATRNLNQILDWWTQWPESNIGIPTGTASGVFILDVDPRHGGEESYDNLDLKPAEIENSYVVTTGGGGKHIYFGLPQDRYRSCATNIAPGLDIRCDGGFVVAATSNHVSGKSYRMDSTPSNPGGPLSPPPQKILNLLSEGPGRPTPRMLPKTFEDGMRNEALFTIANDLAFSNISRESVMDVLKRENESRCKPPKSKEVLETILNSAFKYDPGFDIDGTRIKPIPLPELPDVLPFDPALLPEGIRDHVVDVAERMQVPLDFVGPSLMLTVGSLIGRQVKICPKAHDDWMVAPNLWGGFVAPPGSRKSAALDAILKPIWDLESAGEKAYRKALPSFLAKLAIYEEGQKSLNSKAAKILKNNSAQKQDDKTELLEKPTPPVRKRYLTNDTTVEALTLILEDNPNGLLIASDELAKFIHDIEKPYQKAARGFYNSTWGTESGFRSDRVGRGTSLTGEICVSILGTIQPEPLSALISKWSCSPELLDGFLQRFQVLVYPDVPQITEIVDRAPDKDALERAHSLIKELADVDALNLSLAKNSDGQAYLHLDSESQEILNGWLLENAKRSNEPSEPDIMKAYLNKLPKVLASFCLIIHMLDDRGPVIRASSIRKSLSWVKYLESHTRRIYTPSLSKKFQGAKELIRMIFIKNKFGDEFSPREVTRGGGNLFKPTSRAIEALEVLVDRAYLFDITPETGKGRSRRYRVNPNAREILG